MVDNKFITCSTCGTTINLRIQLGYFNIPFHVNCPNCDILINGKVILEDAENYYRGPERLRGICIDKK